MRQVRARLPRARARTCPAALPPERAGDARERGRWEPSRARTPGADQLARSRGGCASPAGRWHQGLATCRAGPPQASCLWLRPQSPAHTAVPFALATHLKAPPSGPAPPPAARAGRSPPFLPAPLPGGGRAVFAAPGSLRGKEAMPENPGQWRGDQRPPPCRPHRSCGPCPHPPRGLPDPGPPRAGPATRAAHALEALAKERSFCTNVTLLFLIMKIAGN